MTAPWLDIPATGHQVAMRFHEFYKVIDQQIVEMQAIWDIPELMMQCNAWPMAPQLGRFWQVPGRRHRTVFSRASETWLVQKARLIWLRPCSAIYCGLRPKGLRACD